MPCDYRAEWWPRGLPTRSEPARIVDLSSGGAQLTSATAPTTPELGVALWLPDDPVELVVDADLVRIISQTEKGGFAWAVRFAGLPQALQTRLARLAFAEARVRGVGQELVPIPDDEEWI